MNEQYNPKIYIALALYLTSLIASNTLGLKLMPFVFGTHLSVAIFFFPFVFLTTDVIGYVFGKDLAKTFVWAGFLTTAVFTLYTILANLMPWSQDALKFKDAYGMIFSVSIRMSIASLLAFIIGEYQDIIIFFLTHDRFKSISFFWRSTLSNIWSQLLDTIIFMFVAFSGVYSIKAIIMMSIPWWLYKVGMGVIYTPLSYLGIYLMKPKKYESVGN